MGVKTTISILPHEAIQLIEMKCRQILQQGNQEVLAELATRVCDLASEGGECYYRFWICDEVDDWPYRYKYLDCDGRIVISNNEEE